MTHNIKLTDYLQKLFGRTCNDFIHAPPEPTAIRVNTLKTTQESMRKRLNAWGIDHEPLFFSPAGCTLRNDSLPLSHTIDFFRGFFAYQGISSQIPPIILNPSPGDRVLDMAAAPGSKTTQMAGLMQNEGLLVANDVSRSRLQPLNVNTQRHGLINHLLYLLPGERIGNLFPEFFDKILLDAPCTGLGTLSSHDEIWLWWNYERLGKLVALQKQLLISGLKALKPGGEIVYSTCSVAPEENEQVIQQILQAYPVEILSAGRTWFEQYDQGLHNYRETVFETTMNEGIRVFPHRHGQEGFFVIKLKKTDTIPMWKKEPVEKYIATSTVEEEPVAKILQMVSRDWGIPYHYWEQYRFLRTSKRIWMFNKTIDRIPETGYTNGGLMLAEKRLSMWKLPSQAVQFFGNAITERRLDLTDDELIRLFSDGRLKKGGVANGYYVLVWKEEPVAGLYVEGGEIRIRLPHAFRLVL